MNTKRKDELKRELAEQIGQAQEVRKIFQDSTESYLPLALKYRRMARRVSERIPLDIIPLRAGAAGPFMDEIDKGEVIYER